MSQKINGLPPGEPSVSLSWVEVWTLALTRPSVPTFEQITGDPGATRGRAFHWLFFSNAIGFALAFLIQQVTSASPTTVDVPELGSMTLPALLSVLLTIIYVFVAQLIAKTLGGTGTYSMMFYAFAAALAPLTLIGAVISSVPIIQYLDYPLAIYGIVLNVLAVRAVHQFGWAKAIASNVHAIIVAIIVPIALVAGLYLLTNLNADLRDEDYATLSAALAQKYNNDDRIPTASMGLNREPTGVWLAIEISYTGECTAATSSDPCNQLANDLVEIVFDNYRKVSELAGIRVIIGKKPHFLTVEASDIMFGKSLAIEEWRKELSLQK